MGLCLAKQLMSPQKIIVISKVHYFDSLISCLYTLNPLSLSLKWVMTLVETIYREERGEREILQNYQHNKGKGVRKWTIIFIYRLNIVQLDSYQADEIIMEIEEWKQKLADDDVKSLRRNLLGVLETSVLS